MIDTIINLLKPKIKFNILVKHNGAVVKLALRHLRECGISVNEVREATVRDENGNPIMDVLVFRCKSSKETFEAYKTVQGMSEINYEGRTLVGFEG